MSATPATCASSLIRPPGRSARCPAPEIETLAGTVKSPGDTAVPRGLDTVTRPRAARCGTSTVSSVAELPRMRAAAPPKRTASALPSPAKPRPPTTTTSPGLPDAGETLVTAIGAVPLASTSSEAAIGGPRVPANRKVCRPSATDESIATR